MLKELLGKMVQSVLAWGTPDSIIWEWGCGLIDRMNFSDSNSSPFFVIDDYLVVGENGETHYNSFVSFIKDHGWPPEDILAPWDAYNPDNVEVSWRDLPVAYKGEGVEENLIDIVKYAYSKDGIDLQITYKDGDVEEFEGLSIDEIQPKYLARDIDNKSFTWKDKGFYVLNYSDNSDEKITYRDLMLELEDKVYGQGRIFHGKYYKFIAFWNNEDAADAFYVLYQRFGADISNYIFIASEDYDTAKDCYGKSGMPTYGEWIKGECNNFDNEKENALKEKFKAIHLANQKEKNNYFQNFRQNRGELQGQKLGKMTMAQYHNLIRQENRERVKKIIKETIERMIKEMRL